jgi:riboflavin synthase
MFTGLIADLGTLVALERDGETATLSIDTRLAPELAPGDSIAVSGVCLTATRVRDGGFAATAIGETLRRSSLGDLEPGARVNLELALRANDRLGGHIVQGHVDGAGIVREVRPDGDARVLAIDCDRAGIERYLIEKGSIAVDGVSLTVSALRERGFEVSLIPETLARTTLGEAAVGDRVNLEADALAKHVARLMEVPA